MSTIPTRSIWNKSLTLLLFSGITFALFSFTPKNNSIQKGDISENTNLVIGEIKWTGNTLYTAEELNAYMGLKNGVPFDEEAIKTKMLMKDDGSDLSSLYMNQGYLFFNVGVQHTQENGKVTVLFEMYEGHIIHVQNVRVKGNKKVATDEIMALINIKAGEVFNRSKVLNAQNAIIKSGWFDTDQVYVNPIPNPKTNTVDMEFVVIEKP